MAFFYDFKSTSKPTPNDKTIYNEENAWFFLTSSVRYLLTNSVALEPEGSSPHSQQPAKGP
jgi:hypothetical protein